MNAVSRPMMLVGALQGIVLWWLWHVSENKLWPHDIPMLMGAVLWSVLAVPAAFHFSENSGLSAPRRFKLVLGVAVIFTLLGIYAGWLGEPLENMERSARLPSIWGGFAQVLASVTLGFMLVPLVAGRVSGRWDYTRLFSLAWRNALLGISVFAVTGLFWVVLYAGAFLMDSIGLHFIRELIQKPIFMFPVTGIVVGAVFAQGHARAEALVNLRGYALSLQAWLLPLLMMFGVMWVVALPFTGLAPLLATRAAAFILLWFAALAVHLLNCAWQDGARSFGYPRWLESLVRASWITLPVVTGVAGWALWQRIEQYGWTEDRIWAAFVWLVAVGYAFGYALSLLPVLQKKLMPNCDASQWMGSLPGTNIFMSLFMLAALLLMVSPAADPRRLAVKDQVQRLQAGLVEPAKFDYDYLRWRSDRWGLIALDELAKAKGDERVADIAARARQSLARKQRWGDQDDKGAAVLTREEVVKRITLLKSPGDMATLPDSLNDFLRQPANLGASNECLHPERTCSIWMRDFNDDGVPEAVLLVNYSRAKDARPRAALFSMQEGQWRKVKEFGNGLRMDEWESAISNGSARTVNPEWQDLELNGQRVRATPPW